ncbi:hypothetical protein PFISCL1PPCAC_24341 [Pristionchus fissidentatus]|uniref:SET domain-containing protein n=1 Tax=Pristionchus fissidentatus TaxID=1538716 RepID=A0AAV5WQS5_9BILA|nr:hypothetical protein PFISCL1PPCAC_24341 [Pristionchus fissidentatus]
MCKMQDCSLLQYCLSEERLENSQVDARLIVRMLIRRKNGDEVKAKAFNGRTFGDLMHHCDEIRAIHVMHTLIKRTVVTEVENFISSDLLVDDEELLKYFGKKRTNVHAITGAISCEHLGSALYLGLSAHDHSCAPDAHIRIRGRAAVLRSPNVGQTYSDKLTVSYALENMCQPTKQRRAELRNWFFDCRCKRCMDTEKDGYARSIKCHACSDGLCLVTDESTSLTCIKCSAVSPVTVDKANKMNEDVMKNIEILNNTKDYEKYAVFYKETAKILSKKNLPLAVLAFR